MDQLQIEENRRRFAAYYESYTREKAVQEEILCQVMIAFNALSLGNSTAEANGNGSGSGSGSGSSPSPPTNLSGISSPSPPTNLSGISTSQPKRSEHPEGSCMIKATESALKLERQRLQLLKQLNGINQSLTNEDFGSTERHIARLIKTIRPTKENVSTKASELIKIFNNPRCPQTISFANFAKKVVSRCTRPDNAPFACGHLIVLVTSQSPQAMDLVLAELQGACIYTVPKHLSYSKSSFESQSKKDYLDQLESYMKFYGALVQTDVEGCHNFHGLNEGWAWLARFLNALPANIYTAVALNAFLQIAGYSLFKKYKSHFRKMLNVISEDFLKDLRDQEDQELKTITAHICSYVEDKKYLQEPKERNLQECLLSRQMVPQ